MKKTRIHLLALSLVICMIVIALAGCATMKSEKGDTGAAAPGQGALRPVVVVATPHVAMDKKTEVIIMGTGFQAGKEIVLLIHDADGVLSDIGSALKPEPKADATGTWATTWDAGEYISKKLIKAGACTITVTDGDYNPITMVPVSFYEKPKKEEKK